MLKSLLCVLLLFFPFSLTAEEAFFCEECTSPSSAQSIVKLKYAPRLQCHSPNPGTPMDPDNVICGSIARNIVLVNPNTSDVYSYRVGHSNQGPRYPVMAWSRALSSQDLYGYSMTAKYLTVYENGIQIAVSTALTSTRNANYINSGSTYSDTSCPTGTALSTLVSPNGMAQLEDNMTLSIMLGMEASPGFNVMNEIESSSVSTTGVGLSYRGGSYNTSWSEKTKKPMINWPFSNSEESSSIKDYFIFEIDSLGLDHNNVPILKYTLSDESRVAGVKLSHLRGKYGPLNITNPCVLDRLEELNNIGEFRNDAGSIVDFNGGTTSGGNPITTCTWHFYQSGRLLYIFNAAGGGCS